MNRPKRLLAANRAWARETSERIPVVHGWIFEIADGQITELATDYAEASVAIGEPAAA